jgi:hypothetical protein
MKLHAASVMALAAAIAAALAGSAQAHGRSPAELLARYQPVVVLDRTEAFAPSSVEGFLADADLERKGPAGSYVPVASSPSWLPIHGEGWRLNHHGCSPDGGLAAVACYRAAGGGPRVVYGRFDVQDGSLVLQYWLFYDYNFWSLEYPASDLVWQAHEGDWEVVTVVLDKDRNPVEAAYSQHCTGERRSWAAVPKAPGTDHPIVHVAAGSHANLFAPGVHPLPRACLPADALAFFDARGVVPRDFAIPGATLDPGTLQLERFQLPHLRWLFFPGTWGETQFLHAPAPIGTVPFGSSPIGPASHDVWVDPLGTIAGWPQSA